jgi:hypothetical protein
MDFLRSLSTRNPRIRQFLYSFLILIPLLGVFHFCCLRLGSLDLFHNTLWKMAFCLGGRALSVSLCELGCSGGLAFVFVVKAFLTAEAAPLLVHYMAPSGADEGSSTSFPKLEWEKALDLPDREPAPKCLQAHLEGELRRLLNIGRTRTLTESTFQKYIERSR